MLLGRALCLQETALPAWAACWEQLPLSGEEARKGTGLTGCLPPPCSPQPRGAPCASPGRGAAEGSLAPHWLQNLGAASLETCWQEGHFIPRGGWGELGAPADLEAVVPSVPRRQQLYTSHLSHDHSPALVSFSGKVNLQWPRRSPCSIETSPGPSPAAHSPASSQVLPLQPAPGPLRPGAPAPAFFLLALLHLHPPPTFTVPTGEPGRVRTGAGGWGRQRPQQRQRYSMCEALR